MPPYREVPSQSGMLRLLSQGRVDVSPLKAVAVEVEPTRKGRPKASRVDADLVLRWEKKAYHFAVECKAISTPKGIAAAVQATKQASKPPRCYPLVFAPHLGEPELRLLQEQQVSGIDLCGNVLIVVPGEILVSRTGAPNRFRRSGLIKNVYRKNSSVAARVFLLKPRYASITEVMNEIETRGEISRKPQSPRYAAASTRTS